MIASSTVGVKGVDLSGDVSGNAVTAASSGFGPGSGDGVVDGRDAVSGFSLLFEAMFPSAGDRNGAARSSREAGRAVTTDGDFQLM